MPDRFKHYLPLDDRTQKDIWENGRFVLDTNIWLNIYRLSTEERDNLKSILSEKFVLDRLFVPHQVAEEFFRNRKKVIARQHTTSHKIEKLIKTNFDKVQEHLAKKVHKYHPILIREKLKKLISKSLKNIQVEIDKNRDAYPYTLEKDENLVYVLELFKDIIGPSFNDKELSSIQQEALERQKKKIPPGYCDEKKDGPDKGYGDFYIWKQIIKKMHEYKSHCIFVTDDSKEDWLLKIDNKQQGAHPMLRKEYFEQTNYEFYLCDQKQFLGWANKQREVNKQLAEAEMLKLFESIDSAAEAYDIKPFDMTPIPEDPSVKDIVDWVHDNFEDPAHGVPYNGREGGYLFIYGGDYEIWDIVSDYFDGVDSDILEEAEAELSGENWTWVRRGLY